MAKSAIVEEVIMEVADELEEAAMATRRLDSKVISSVFVGVTIGVAIGFYVGYRYSKKKLRADIFAEAEEEIRIVREHYRKKAVAATNQEKEAVEDIVRDKGYISVTESNVTESDITVHPNTMGSNDPRSDPNVSEPNEPSEEPEKGKDDDWDWDEQLANRNNTDPYIIHQDEYETNESGYAQVAYIYYRGDNTLVDEDDPTDILDRTKLLPPDIIRQFGFGSDDYDTVYVRNPFLELDIAIHRVPGRHDEDVQGLNPDDSTG